MIIGLRVYHKQYGIGEIWNASVNGYIIKFDEVEKTYPLGCIGDILELFEVENRTATINYIKQFEAEVDKVREKLLVNKIVELIGNNEITNFNYFSITIIIEGINQYLASKTNILSRVEKYITTRNALITQLVRTNQLNGEERAILKEAIEKFDKICVDMLVFESQKLENEYKNKCFKMISAFDNDEAIKLRDWHDNYVERFSGFRTIIILSKRLHANGKIKCIGLDKNRGKVVHLIPMSTAVGQSDDHTYQIGTRLRMYINKVTREKTPNVYKYDVTRVKLLKNSNGLTDVRKMINQIKEYADPVFDFDKVLNIEGNQFCLVHFTHTELKKYTGAQEPRYQLKMNNKFVNIFGNKYLLESNLGKIYSGYTLVECKLNKEGTITYWAHELYGDFHEKPIVSKDEKFDFEDMMDHEDNDDISDLMIEDFYEDYYEANDFWEEDYMDESLTGYSDYETCTDDDNEFIEDWNEKVSRIRFIEDEQNDYISNSDRDLYEEVMICPHIEPYRKKKLNNNASDNEITLLDFNETEDLSDLLPF